MVVEDSPRAWVMAIAACLINLIIIGMERASGVLFVALLANDRSLTREAASWPFSLPGAAVVFIAPLTGILVPRFSALCISLSASFIYFTGILPCYFTTNIYVLSIFYGILTGCGLGIVQTLMPVVINNTFKKHRGTAMGISTSGVPIGGLVWPIVVQALLDKYGLNSAFLWLAMLSLSTVLFSMAFTEYKNVNSSFQNEQTSILYQESKLRYQSFSSDKKEVEEKISKPGSSQIPPNPVIPGIITGKRGNFDKPLRDTDKLLSSPDPRENELKPNRPTFNKLALKNIFTNRGFYFVTANQIICVYLSTTFITVIIDYMSDKSIAENLSLYMVTCFSIGEILGRLCFGWVTDKGFLTMQNHSALSLVLSAVLALMLTFTANYDLLMTVAFLLGVFQGTTLSINFVLLADYVTKDEIPLAVAFCRSINGAASVTRSPIIGLFRDELGSYDNLFRLLAGLSLVLAIAWILESRVVAWKKKNQVNAPTMS